MKHWKAAAFALAAFAIASPASAFIPPFYKLTVLAETRDDEALNRALFEAMQTLDAFQWAGGGLYRSDVMPCLKESDPGNCLREKLVAARRDGSDPAVVVWATRQDGDGHVFTWHCIGDAVNETPVAERTATVDLEAALFGEEQARNANLGAAMSCLSSAGREAG